VADLGTDYLLIYNDQSLMLIHCQPPAKHSDRTA